MRTVHPTLARTFIGALAATMSLSCGGEGGRSSPTGPTSPAAGGIQVVVAFVASGGTYTAQLASRTFTAEGGFVVPLQPGTHEISGTFRSAIFGVRVAGLGGPGPESRSLRSLAGPAPQTENCQVTYDNFSTPNTQREFRVQFRTTSNVGSVCQ